MADEVTVSAEDREAILHPEMRTDVFTVGGKKVSVRPLTRRWQSLFYKAALPIYQAELRPIEIVVKQLKDGTFLYSDTTKLLVDAEIEADAPLDRAAAIILASQIPGAEKKSEVVITEQEEFVRDQSTTDELRALVDAQQKVERLVERVGERFPARYALFLRLAGEKNVPEDALKQLLDNLRANSLEKTGDGNLTLPKSSG